MAVKPCRQNRAVFLDSLLLPSRDSSPLVRLSRPSLTIHKTDLGPGLRQNFGNHPAGDELRLGRAALPFSSHQRLQNCRGRPAKSRDGPGLNTVLKELRALVRRGKVLRVLRIMIRAFLEGLTIFRAYQKSPELNLTTATGSIEAINRRVGDLMRQTRSYIPAGTASTGIALI